MATTPTQLLVPSEKPQDLKFNAGKIDEFVTSMGWTYTDRFGNKHYTIEGINYLAQQTMNAFGYVTLSGVDFTTGATISNPNEVLFNDADSSYYKWTGSLASGAKIVPANSTPESTGGIGPGKWLNVGDSSLRADISSSGGAGIIGTTNGKTVQENIDYLQYANGVRLSEFLSESDPINSALAKSRDLGVPFIADADITYTNPVILYGGDTIIAIGRPKWTKTGNATPSPPLPLIQHPDRPNGVMADFNVDAGIIIAFTATKAAKNITITGGLDMRSTSKSNYCLFAPSCSDSLIEDIHQDNFLKGFKFLNSYLTKIRKFFSVYWYSASDVYTDNICYDISDDNYSSGTTLILEHVYCTNYKWPFYCSFLESSSFISCGGEAVRSANTPTPTNMPRVFEFKNCPTITLNSPHSENLYGGFIRFSSDVSGITQGACTLLVTNPQLTTGIIGTDIDVNAKVIDIEGNASCVINGGVLIGAAEGKFLKFGGASSDSFLEVNGTDLRFAKTEIIKDSELYTGVASVKGRIPLHCIIRGALTTSTNVVNWKTTGDDPFEMRKSGNFIRVPLGGWYSISAVVLVGESHSDGMVAISVGRDASDTGEVMASQNILNSTTRQSVTVNTELRLNSGDHVYIRVINATSSVTDNDFNAKFCVSNI